MRTVSKLGAIVGAGLLLFAVGATTLVSAKANGGVNVTLCHATPPDTGAKGWHTITTSTSSDGNLQGGHDTSHDADIIPPYTDGTFSYPGKNLTTLFDGVLGSAILANDCASPRGTGGPPPSEAPSASPVVTGQPATDALGTGSSGPSQTAWLLVVALGVILASVVILTPARVKNRR